MRKRLNPRALKILCVFVAAGGLGLWVFDPFASTPDKAAEDFRRACQRQDWRAIYRMASDGERQYIKVSEDQYVRLARKLAEQSQPGALSEIEIKPGDQIIGQGSRTYSGELLTLRGKRDSRGFSLAAFGFQVERDANGWHPLIGSIPIQLSHLTKNPERRYEELADALDSVGLVELHFMDDRSYTTAPLLRQVASGELKPDRMYKFEPHG